MFTRSRIILLILHLVVLGLNVPVAAQNDRGMLPDFDNIADYRQVAIEALVVEINEDVARQYGIEYTMNRDDESNPGNVIEAFDVRFPFKADDVSVPIFTDTANGYQIGRISRLPGLGFSFLGIDTNSGQIPVLSGYC